MPYNPYHIDHRWSVEHHGPAHRATGSFAPTGILRTLVWLLLIAVCVVGLVVGTRPQALVSVLDLVLLLAAGSMVVCLAGLVLLSLGDRLWDAGAYRGLSSLGRRR